MPLIIRYVDHEKQIQESFVEFIECAEGTTGAQLATLIENACQNLGLDMSQCRGQGYDGAGNVSGVCRSLKHCSITQSKVSIFPLCLAQIESLCCSLVQAY